MGLIRGSRPPGFSVKGKLPALVLLGFLLFSGPFLHGQNTGGILAATELQNIDKKLKDPSLSGAERRGILKNLARLLHLSGNIEGAAQVWMEAAYAEPGNRDDGAILEGAECFIAMGELDRAEAGVRTVSLTGDPAARIKARYMAALIDAFRSGNPAVLIRTLDEPAYGDLKPAAYYILWKIFGAGDYKSRLLSEFPASPEALIVQREENAAASGGSAVSASPRPMWFLFPGRDGIAAGTPSAPASPSPVSPPAPQATAPPAVTPPRPPVPEPAAAAGGPRAFQTGLFSREENARAMGERLRAAGFTPEIAPRRVNGSAYWAVSVPPGPDPNTTLLRLKDAGFESFPVF